MVGIFQMVLTLWISKVKDYPKESTPFSFKLLVKQLKQSALVLIMPIFVVGSVVYGIATATESAGLGVLYAIAIGYFVTRHMKREELIRAFRSSIMTSAKIMMIIAYSQVFIWVLALERVPEDVALFVSSLGLSPIPMMLLIVLVILAAGTFIDVSPAILLLTPVFLPTVTAAGISPIVFGVILVAGLAVGACTPPVGNCLNVCSIVSGLRIGTIFRGAAVFLAANVLMLVLLTLFPALVLWLPELFMGN
jgi:tripartite ATP-independent transporter DctM subunit